MFSFSKKIKKAMIGILALAMLSTTFIGCGGGGASATATPVNPGGTKIDGTLTPSGVNYVFNDSINISWPAKSVASNINVFGTTLKVDGISYDISWTSSTVTAINQTSLAVPFSFSKTLPASDLDRLAEVTFTYNIGGEGSKTITIPYILNAKTKGSFDFKLEAIIDIPNDIPAAGGTFSYVLNLKNNTTGITVPGAIVNYTILTPDYVTNSLKSGQLTTDSGGALRLDVTVAANTGANPRAIIIGFTYESEILSLVSTQSGTENGVEFEFVATSGLPDNVPDTIGTFSYVLNLKSNTTGTTVPGAIVNYTILTPSYVTSATSGTLTTDSGGALRLDVDFKANGGTTDRDIIIAFTYENAILSIATTQLAP